MKTAKKVAAKKKKTPFQRPLLSGNPTDPVGN